MHKVSRRATQSLLAHSHDKKRWPTASSSFLRLPDPGDRRQCGARRARARRSGAARRAGFRRDDRDLARGYHPPQSQSRHPRRPFGVARRASGGARGAGGHLRDDSRRAADVVSLFSRRSLPASETGPRQPGAADTSAVRPRQSAANPLRAEFDRLIRESIDRLKSSGEHRWVGAFKEELLVRPELRDMLVEGRDGLVASAREDGVIRPGIEAFVSDVAEGLQRDEALRTGSTDGLWRQHPKRPSATRTRSLPSSPRRSRSAIRSMQRERSSSALARTCNVSCPYQRNVGRRSAGALEARP